MSTGEWLPDVRFSREVRDSLTKLLDRYGAPRIITELADIAAGVPALAAPNRRATRTVLAARRRAVRELRNALNRPDDPADTMLESELTYRGRHPKRPWRPSAKCSPCSTPRWGQLTGDWRTAEVGARRTVKRAT
jgi:hypothetical protein